MAIPVEIGPVASGPRKAHWTTTRPCYTRTRTVIASLNQESTPTSWRSSNDLTRFLTRLASQGIADNVRTVMAAANDSLTAQGVELRWMVSSV
jgi:hypothetical protein